MRIFLCSLCSSPAPLWATMGTMTRPQLFDSGRAAALLNRLARRARPATREIVSLDAPDTRVAGLLELRQLCAPRVVTVEEPRLASLLARQTAVPTDGATFETEPVFLATLADAVFDPHSGALWDASGALVLDSIKNSGRLKHVASGPVVPEVLPGLYSSIAGPISGNTFHWLVESLPRLYSLTHVAEPVTLLMPDTLPAARLEQLRACLPLGVSLRLVSGRSRYRVERFVLPSYLTTRWDFAYMPVEHLTYTRDCLHQAAGVSSSSSGERLYISRAQARVRRVLNEAAVMEVLSAFGFRSCRLEGLSLAEQVRLFSAADVVVAPHGAGLANLLFAGRIPVLELHCRAVSPVYFFLALALGQPYDYLYPQELTGDVLVPSPADGRLYSATRDLDFSVDIDALHTIAASW